LFFTPRRILKKLGYSASYAGLEEWAKSVEDAKECIRLDPQFMKGYYRLATAQLEQKHYDMALATIKQGLSLDANNSQLLKVMRNIKHAKGAGTIVPETNGKKLDTATSQELHDLQLQHAETTREYNKVQANLSKLQREHKINQITFDELEKNPSDGAYFRSTGKLFMKHGRDDVFGHLKVVMGEQGKRQSELIQKMEFLERRIQSQQQNVQELRSSR
jgi:tetratricopeptide (TPR) repeat protein